MTITTAKIRRILVLLGILVAMALPLMFMLKNFVREAIVLPFAYQAWIIGIVVDALPQGLFLGVAVLVGVMIAGRSLQRSRATTKVGQVRSHRSDGSVKIWLERVDHVSMGSYSRDRFGHYIGQFLLQALAYEERLSVREIRSRIDTGELDLPEDIRDYVDLTRQPATSNSRNLLLQIWRYLRRLFRRRRSQRTTAEKIWAETDPVLSYIEQQLRIQPAEADK